VDRRPCGGARRIGWGDAVSARARLGGRWTRVASKWCAEPETIDAAGSTTGSASPAGCGMKTRAVPAHDAKGIARLLAARIVELTLVLLPNGHREGHEWRAGSVAGEPGDSLGVHLTGHKAGVWSDFSVGIGGDALDLIAAVLGLSIGEAMAWARRWLGIEAGEAVLPRPAEKSPNSVQDADRWRHPWARARPIPGTPAEAYLRGRKLVFDDPEGRVLRFVERRARKNPDTDKLENYPALLCALSDIRSGEQVGIVNIFLEPGGRDRLRDGKGKTNTGRSKGAAVMLSAFDEPTDGLVICEGAETGVALLMAGIAPVWACAGAGTMTQFPVLGGVEALTIAADADTPGQQAAEAAAQRWRSAGREVSIIAPPAGDWAAPERESARHERA
jgi:Toprim domain